VGTGSPVTNRSGPWPLVARHRAGATGGTVGAAAERVAVRADRGSLRWAAPAAAGPGGVSGAPHARFCSPGDPAGGICGPLVAFRLSPGRRRPRPGALHIRAAVLG